MTHEILALLIFFATWAIVNRFMKKDISNEKGNSAGGDVAITFGKKTRSSAEITEQIKDLCQNQFTKALRMYRVLVKSGDDKFITEEAFYTAIVEASIRVGMSHSAMEVAHRMHENNIVPSVNFLQSFLKLLAARKCFAECIEVYNIFKPEPEQVIFSCLTLAASELGDVNMCREFLQQSGKKFKLTSRDFVPLIRVHHRRRDHESAIAELRSLMKQGIEIDPVVFNTALSVCVGAQNVKVMRELMAEMRDYQKGFNNKVVDTVSYNTLMKGFAKLRDLKGCFELLDEVVASDVEPDDITFSTLLDVCIDENENDLASQALEKMCASGVKMNCVLLTTLMKGFIRSKRLDMAMNVFSSMRLESSQVKPDMITYSMLIKAQCDNGDMGTALSILEDMLQNSHDIDDVVFTHLIEGCATVSNQALAEKLYRDMLIAKIRPSIYTLTAMVKVHGKCGNSDLAWDLVRTMEDEHGIKPTVVIVTCLVSGLLRQKKNDEAWEAFKWMSTTGGCPPDSHGVQTMINGLADAQMFKEVIEVARDALVNRKPALRVNAECLNHALSGMLSRGDKTSARILFGIMAEKQVQITTPNVARRLGLE